jgi:rare lipoprotein A (peptidoglycan hydrolase)
MPCGFRTGGNLYASHYGVGDGYGGRRTASGERMNPQAMTAAHRSLPFGTRVHVTGPRGTVVVRINDRGPFVKGRCIDLSWGGACARLRRAVPRHAELKAWRLVRQPRTRTGMPLNI